MEQSTFGKCARAASFAPLFIVSTLLCWSYYTVIVSICISYRIASQKQTARAAVLILAFHAIWLPAVLSLFQLVRRGPGYVPSAQERRFDSAVHHEAQESGFDTAPLLPVQDEAHLQLSQSEIRPRPRAGSDSSEKRDVQAYLAASEQSLMTKANGGTRWCRKCGVPKPDRAHHCRVCGRCVLKLDHHCGVLSTCIGHRNYHCFLLFLVYSTLVCGYSAILSGFTLVHFVQNVPDGFELSPVNWSMLLMIGAVFCMVLSGFTTYHFFLVKANRTTIESMETTRIKLGVWDATKPTEDQPVYRGDHALSWEERRALRRSAGEAHIYDLGWRRNFAQVFGGGRSWVAFVLPIGKADGTGQSFPVNHLNIAKLQEIQKRIRLAQS